MRTSSIFVKSGLAAFAALTMLTGWSTLTLQQSMPGQQRWHTARPYGLNHVPQSLRLGTAGGPHSALAPVLPLNTRSYMSPGAVGKPLIFVADGWRTVYIYLQTGTHRLVGWITGLDGPADLATDVAGNLYISILGISGTTEVLVYAPPYTKGPKLTLQKGSGPFGVSVSPQGVVAITGCTSPSCGGVGVTFYAPGSSVPCAAVVAPPAFNNLGYDAFDDQGNLYVDAYNPSTGGLVGEIDGGCNAKSMIPLATGNTIGYPGGIQIDKADRIAILDSSSNAVIDTYSQPKNGSLGTPVSTTPLASSPSAAAFTFLASGRDIWVADANGRASNYDYPTGGVSEQTIIGGGTPYGIAVTPPLLP